MITVNRVIFIAVSDLILRTHIRLIPGLNAIPPLLRQNKKLKKKNKLKAVQSLFFFPRF